MGGNDKEDGTRHGIFWGKSAIDGDKKEDGWQRQRRMNKTWHFLGERMSSTATRKKMGSNDKEDGWHRQKRWMATKEKMEQDKAFFGERMPSTVTRKKMDGNDKEDGTRHGIFWGKSAINGDKKEDG